MDRKQQLLATALELFDERGVRGASMRELARRAGVDVRTAYYHFESKRDLLRSLFEEAGYFQPLRQQVGPAILDRLRTAPPDEALLGIIEGSLQLLYEGAAHFRLIHVEVLYGDDDAKAVGHELWDRWGQTLETLVDAAGVVPNGEAAAWARFLRSLLWGVFNEAQLTGSLADPSDRRQRAQELTAVLMQRTPACRRPARKR
ncbi:MAG: TetR/AcrR family transcriptional regulator [Acidimicrobiales bacterium]